MLDEEAEYLKAGFLREGPKCENGFINFHMSRVIDINGFCQTIVANSQGTRYRFSLFAVGRDSGLTVSRIEKGKKEFILILLSEKRVNFDELNIAGEGQLLRQQG